MKYVRQHISLLFFVMLGLGLSSCGKKKKTLGETPTEEVAPAPESDVAPRAVEPDTGEGVSRICPFEIEGLDKSALEAYLYPDPQARLPLSNIRGPATACLKLYLDDYRNFDASFRVEVEPTRGLVWYNLTKDYTIYSEINTSKVRLLWMDTAGFVEIEGPYLGGNEYEATIRFVNFPFEEDLDVFDTYDDSFNYTYNQCSSGAWNFSQCAPGQTSFPVVWDWSNWWHSVDEVVSVAEEYLDGEHGGETGTIGTFSFLLSEVEAN